MSTTTDEPAKSRTLAALRSLVRISGTDKFIVRFVPIVLLVFAFYNPTRYCWVAWIFPDGPAPVKDWIGLHLWQITTGVLFLGLTLYLVRMTDKALGHMGTALLTAVMLCLFGLFAWNVDVRWTGGLLMTVGQLGVAFLLTAGLLAANINRRIAGMVTTTQAGPVDAHITGGHHG